MQIPSPPSPTLPKHDPPPSSAEERWSQPPLGDPPLPAASSSSQAGGRVRESGPREDDLNAEAPPAYTASANVWQGEVTLEDRLRRPFERVNRRQRLPPPLQQQYVPPPPPQQMPPFRHPLPPGMRLVNVTYQHQRRTGQYRYQVQYQQQDQPPRQSPRSSSPPVSSANIPPAPPQHTHSRTATQPPSRPPSPSSTSSASSDTPVSDFVQDVSDFARSISDFARHFSAAGAGDWSTERMGGPGGSSSTALPSTRTVTVINVVHNINIIRDQNHSFAFGFWGIARAFYAYLVHMVYGRPSTLPVEDGEGGSESRDYDDLPSWTPGHPDPPYWARGH